MFFVPGVLVLLAAACSGGDKVDVSPIPTEPTDTPTANASIVNGFLLLEGSEHFGAIPPCTGFQANDEDTADSPISVGALPEGAIETASSVSFCPDGKILSARRVFELPSERGHELRISYRRAPSSFPIVLTSPTTQQIEPIEINGQRGLLVFQAETPQNSPAYRTPRLRFWVDEQSFLQEAGAYVEISWNLEVPDIHDRLIAIAESVVVDDPTDTTR